MQKTIVFALLSLVLAGNGAVLEKIKVYSPSMKKDVPVGVMLPDKYFTDPGAEWPVVYMLHGAGGTWETHCSKPVMFFADKEDVIIVSPDGAKTSWWFDSPVNPEMKYETFVARELVDYIDKNYRTYGTRTQRGIVGGSMGGHGACWLGFRNSDVFGAVGNIYGGVDLWDFPDAWELKKVLGERDKHPENWRTHSALAAAAKLKNGEVEILSMVGTEDFFLKGNRRMHELLSSNGVEHTYIEHRSYDKATSGHNGLFHAKARPVMMAFLGNYFRSGKGQIAMAHAPLTTRYGVKVVKAQRGETAWPEVVLPPKWKLVTGDDGLTGCDVRDFYFTVEANGTDEPPPVVVLKWPGVKTSGIYGAKDIKIDGDTITLVPVRKNAPPTLYATGWKDGAIEYLFHHHVEGAQHGPYAGKPLPLNEIKAGDNWRIAAGAMFKRADIATLEKTDGGFIRLYGFDSNFPNRHVDHPPHFHIMLEWGGWSNNNVGHYVLDGEGKIEKNNFLLMGVDLKHPKGKYYVHKRGERTEYRGRSGNVVFSLDMLEDGTGLVLKKPGCEKEWKIASAKPVESVTFSERENSSSPWVELASYSVSDDTVAGLMEIAEIANSKKQTTKVFYDPRTGALKSTEKQGR